MFANRTVAGERLSERLASYRASGSVVIGLARGGVVIAKTVGQKLSLPYDVAVIKKISPPYNPELAIGAVAPDGISIIDYKSVQNLGIDDRYLQEEIQKKSELVKQKMQLYRKGKSPLSLQNKTVIVVDDGAATGSTIEAAIKWFRAKKVRKIVVSLPVAPPQIVAKIKPEVDELVVLDTPEGFASVGQFYQQFDQVEDQEVVQLLQLDRL